MTIGPASARSAGVSTGGRKQGRTAMALAAQRAQADGTDARARLLEISRKKSLLRGTFKLVSGATSNYYLDMKPTTFDPEGATLIAEIICGTLEGDTDVDSIGGLELGAVPIVAAVCAESFRHRPVNGFVVRKEKKGHGTDQKIDGNFKPNTSVVLLEDVTTKGGRVKQAVK